MANLLKRWKRGDAPSREEWEENDRDEEYGEVGELYDEAEELDWDEEYEEADESYDEVDEEAEGVEEAVDAEEAEGLDWDEEYEEADELYDEVESVEAEVAEEIGELYSDAGAEALASEEEETEESDWDEEYDEADEEYEEPLNEAGEEYEGSLDEADEEYEEPLDEEDEEDVFAQEEDWEDEEEESGYYFDEDGRGVYGEEHDISKYGAAALEEDEEEALYERDRQRQKGASRLDWMDKVMILTGVAVLALACCVAGFYLRYRERMEERKMLMAMGSSIETIELPGQTGLVAVADAEAAKKAAAQALAEEQRRQEEEAAANQLPVYQEEDYQNDITVALNLTSIEKDLKIKFTNRETGKLISNVPFAVKITRDGGDEEWKDDDMDGIIYHTDLSPGKYQVSVNALEGERYKNYGLPQAQSVDVKAQITYAKVDVSDEVKTEAEVDVSKEDTQVHDTKVEEQLDDTVEWVDSSATVSGYKEVDKQTIVDPLTTVPLASKGASRGVSAGKPEMPAASQTVRPTPMAQGYRTMPMSTNQAAYPASAAGQAMATRPTSVMAAASHGYRATPLSAATAPEVAPESQGEPAGPDTAAAQSEANPATTGTPESLETPEAPTGTPEVPSETPEAPSGTPEAPSETPEAPATSETPSATPEAPATISSTTDPVQGTESEGQTVAFMGASISETTKTLSVGETFTLTASSTVVEVRDVVWTSSNPLVASVDGAGVVTALSAGVTEISYQANGVPSDGGSPVSGLTAACHVTVQELMDKRVELDNKSVTVWTGSPVTVAAKLVGEASGDVAWTVETSDANVATAAIADGTVTISGVSGGSAKITVKMTDAAGTLQASCDVTVKEHPQTDHATLLKDFAGNQVYVFENGSYREAVYADYYTFEKFYIQEGAKYTGWQTINGKVYYFDANGDKVTGEQIIEGAKYQFGEDGVLNTGSGVRGIDVSKWNGDIDWSAVKNSGIEFVIIRCGYRGSGNGALVEDPKFKANISGASSAGLKVGVYFFTQAISAAEAVEEASMVLGQVKNYSLSYPIFLDVEATDGNRGRADKIDNATRTAVCKAFCETIRNSGYRAGIYANKTWLSEKMDASALSSYTIWLAQYASSPTYTGKYDMWQYQSTGKISGISTDVDMNWSYIQ